MRTLETFASIKARHFLKALYELKSDLYIAPTPDTESIQKRLLKERMIAVLSCCLVSAVGVLVMAGWSFGIASLRSIRPLFVSMKFNTALSFFLLGMALVVAIIGSARPFWRILSMTFVTIVFIVAACTMLEYSTGLDFGIDQLFIEDTSEQIVTFAPGRMAPTTAVHFLLMSLATFTLMQQSAVFFRYASCLVVFFTSFLTFTGYTYDIIDFYSAAGYSSMAIHTSLCFVALSLSLILAVPNVGIMRFINAETSAGLLLRRLLPAVVLFPLILGWLRRLGESFNLYPPEFGVALYTLANVLIFLGITLRVAVLIHKIDMQKQTAENEKRRAETLIEIKQAEGRSILENIPDAVFKVDGAWCIEMVNLAATRIFGYQANELIGKNMPILISDLHKKVDSYIPTSIESGNTKTIGFGCEAFGHRKDGSDFPIDIVVSEFSDEGSHYFICIVRDITERKEAEAGLRMWKHIFTHAGWAVSVSSDDMVMTHVNPAFAKLHGYLVEELIGRKFDTLFAPDMRDKIPEILKIVDTKGDHTYEAVRMRKDGSEFPTINHLTSFKDGSGKVIFRAGTVQDLSALKREENLRREKEAAELANKTKSAFLANMSHEIRTPLGAVLGFSELMANPNLTSSEKINYVAAIRRNSELLSNVINDILDISKVEAGKLDIEKSDVMISDVVHDIATLLNLRALEKGIRLIVTAEGPIPKSVNTDLTRLRQILLNIVGNAIKFTQKGSVIVTIKQVVDGPSMKLAFVVKDTGCGLTDEQKHRLFTPFSQADVSTTRKFGGTGLGLALARKLANLLGGDVVLSESVLGVGSTFTITIDPGTSQTVLFENFERQKNNNVSILPREVTLKNILVLVVEDAPDIQMLVRHMLIAAGAEVQTASNGREAVDMIENNDYDVILMDIQMPVMDGYEAIKLLRQKGYRKPVIALTAHALKEERERCLAAGFDEHLSKPVHREILLEAVFRYSQNNDQVSLH